MSIDEAFVEVWYIGTHGARDLIRVTFPKEPNARVETNLF